MGLLLPYDSYLNCNLHHWQYCISQTLGLTLEFTPSALWVFILPTADLRTSQFLSLHNYLSQFLIILLFIGHGVVFLWRTLIHGYFLSYLKKKTCPFGSHIIPTVNCEFCGPPFWKQAGCSVTNTCMAAKYLVAILINQIKLKLHRYLGVEFLKN